MERNPEEFSIWVNLPHPTSVDISVLAMEVPGGEKEIIRYMLALLSCDVSAIPERQRLAVVDEKSGKIIHMLPHYNELNQPPDTS